MISQYARGSPIMEIQPIETAYSSTPISLVSLPRLLTFGAQREEVPRAHVDVPDHSVNAQAERNAGSIETEDSEAQLGAIAEEISSLDAESAERKLTELLGAPHHRLPQLGKVLWFLSPDGTATVSINNFRGKSFVLFLARYRFTFIKRL